MDNDQRMSPPEFAAGVRVLSAVLGGAMGGFMGTATVHPIANMIGGMCLGMLASLSFSGVVLILAHALAVLLNIDFDSPPVGCLVNTLLSAVMGGVAGMLSAPIIVLAYRYTTTDSLYVLLSVGCITSILVLLAIVFASKICTNRTWTKRI